MTHTHMILISLSHFHIMYIFMPGKQSIEIIKPIWLLKMNRDERTNEDCDSLSSSLSQKKYENFG